MSHDHASPLDSIDFAGDKHLSAAARQQLDDLDEASIVEVVLKHYGIPKSQAYQWGMEVHGERKALCECLPHVAPDFPHRLVAKRLKYDLKRLTSLNYASVEKSPLGEAVQFHMADSEPFWLVTTMPFLAGHIVVGKRQFPLETPFDGYVASGPDHQCYLFCPLRSFLASNFCKKPF